MGSREEVLAPIADAQAAPGPLQNAQPGGKEGLLQSTLVLPILQPLGCSVERAHFILLTANAGRDGQHPTLQIREMRHRKRRG